MSMPTLMATTVVDRNGVVSSEVTMQVVTMDDIDEYVRGPLSPNLTRDVEKQRHLGAIPKDVRASSPR